MSVLIPTDPPPPDDDRDGDLDGGVELALPVSPPAAAAATSAIGAGVTPAAAALSVESDGDEVEIVGASSAAAAVVVAAVVDDDVILVAEEAASPPAMTSCEWSCLFCRAARRGVRWMPCGCAGAAAAAADAAASASGGAPPLRDDAPFVPSADSVFANAPSAALYPRGAGRGCVELASLFQRGFERGCALHETVRGRAGDPAYARTDVLVSSFGMYPPYDDLALPGAARNALAQLARGGTRVTCVNQWFWERDASGGGQSGGVPVAVLVRGGAHELNSGIVLVHPPMAQHKVDPATGAWTVSVGRGGGKTSLAHPTVAASPEYGCVHPKLFLIRFGDGMLRVCVTTVSCARARRPHMALRMLPLPCFCPLPFPRFPPTHTHPHATGQLW